MTIKKQAEPMSLKEIMKSYLIEHGWNGLWNKEDNYCYCDINDLCKWCEETDLDKTVCYPATIEECIK